MFIAGILVTGFYLRSSAKACEVGFSFFCESAGPFPLLRFLEFGRDKPPLEIVGLTNQLFELLDE